MRQHWVPPPNEDIGHHRAVFGVPGGGLVGAGRTWARNDEVAEHGRKGELATAAILDRYARIGGPTVLHDLNVARGKYTVNIDHAVVFGDMVLIVDSKRWKPGFYWTLGHKTRRGARAFPFADKTTMAKLQDYLQDYLDKRGVRARVLYPIVVVWSSSDRVRLRLWAMRCPGAQVITGDKFSRIASKVLRRVPADPAIVSALAELLPGNATPRHGRSTERATHGAVLLPNDPACYDSTPLLDGPPEPGPFTVAPTPHPVGPTAPEYPSDEF